MKTFAARLKGLGLMLSVASVVPGVARAAEHVTLRNGFEIDCARREAVEGDKTRLYLLANSTAAAPVRSESSYIDVASQAVVRVEILPDSVATVESAKADSVKSSKKISTELTGAEMHTILARAGTQHHIDEDLLASVVKAESGGNVHAVSRTGARGLMQLMPGTATQMGVTDAFRPDQNISGGTAYLDFLLMRYHDDAAMALAAYNAGPGAVDKYHGVPPYRETRAYVARVIREFNRRKMLAASVSKNELAGLHE